MGLRAPSGWSANAPQTKEQPTGLTPKQEDMNGSMYPGAFKPSEPTPKDQNTVTAPEQKQEQGAAKQAAPDKLAQRKQEMQDSGIQQAVQQASQKIGSFKYKLQEMVNTFLQEGPTAIGVKSAWNAQTGKWEDINEEDALHPVLAEKMRQQAKIKAEMNPYLQETSGGTTAKDFSQVIKEMQLGGSDVGTARLLQLSDALDRMNKSGLAGSQEAKALEAQIDDLDQFGMMTALRTAKKDYEDIMGGNALYSGDTGRKGYSAIDLATMEDKKIESELENASVSASGLFSGDFDTDLKRAFDKQSQAAKRSEGVSTETDKQVKNAFDLMLKDTRSGMVAAKTELEKKIEGMLPALKEKFKGIPGFEMWGDMLSNGGTFLETILKAANDPNSGLAADERKQLLKYLGEAGGAKGQMYIWLDELAKGGSFTVEGETVTPTWEQKDQLYRIMNDKNLQGDAKLSAIEKVLNSTMVKDPDAPLDVKQTLDKYLAEALSSTQGGGADVNKFMENISNTMNTFLDSKTEYFFTQAVKKVLGTSEALEGSKGMNLKQLQEAFAKMEPNTKAQIIGDMKANLAATMQTASSTMNEQAAKSLADSDKILKTKKEEILKENQRLTDLQGKNNNIVQTAYSTFYSHLSNVWNQFQSGFYDAVKNVQSQPWAKTMIARGALTSDGVGTIASSQLMDQMKSLLTSAGIPLSTIAMKKTSDFMNLSTGEIDIAGMKKHADAIESLVMLHMNDRQKGYAQFQAGFGASPQGSLIMKQQATRAKSIENALKNVANYSDRLSQAEGNLNKLRTILLNKDPTVTSPDELIKGLIGSTETALTKDTVLNPSLAGMLKQNPDGTYMLSFGDGKFAPVSNEYILQVNDALNGYAVKQGTQDAGVNTDFIDTTLNTKDVTPFGGFVDKYKAPEPEQPVYTPRDGPEPSDVRSDQENMSESGRQGQTQRELDRGANDTAARVDGWVSDPFGNMVAYARDALGEIQGWYSPDGTYTDASTGDADGFGDDSGSSESYNDSSEDRGD